jgi:hypothetical protein
MDYYLYAVFVPRARDTNWRAIYLRQSITCSLKVNPQRLPLVFQDVYRRICECGEIRGSYLRT